MKVSISVANRDEANMITAGLADPQVFALVKIVGALSAFAPRTQERILTWVADRLTDDRQADAPAAPADKSNGGEPRLPGMT